MRRSIVALSLLLGLIGPSRVAAAAAKPNVVLILVDDLGWADLGCYGSRYYETPHLDRLAGQGMRFTDAYAACAVCSPSRAAVLSGRYPPRHGITTWIRSNPGLDQHPAGHQPESKFRLLEPLNHYWMDLEEITAAELLKGAGYATCHIGKWHLGDKKWHPDRQGFDFNIGGCERGSPPSYFDPYKNLLPNLDSRKAGEYLTDREADEAEKFIRNHAGGPFFLYLSHYAVHAPLQSKESLIRKYEKKTPAEQKNPVYAGMIESMDDATGRVMKVLDDLSLADNTLLIFTSDNGGVDASWNGHPEQFYTHNGPLRAGKCWPYEGGIRVPGIVRWPGRVKAGSVCEEPVIGVDWLPTICEAAGVIVPLDRAIDGESLVPLLRQDGDLRREAIYWHFPHYQHAAPNSIVRAGDWKLIRYYETGKEELFNLKNDLPEEHDLADSKPDVVKRLGGMLDEWLKDTGAKLPVPNPGWSGRDRM